MGLVFIDVADPSALSASGPLLGDPVRFQAFRTHLSRPRHQGKQKNDIGKKCFFEKNGSRKKNVSEKLIYGEKHVIKAYSMWTCGHVNMWTCGDVDMSTCAHVDMRTMSTSRHVDMRTWRHADIRTCGHADRSTFFGLGIF